jgi:hypothetical protein
VKHVLRSALTVVGMLLVYAVFPVPGKHTSMGLTLVVALAGFGGIAWATLSMIRQARRPEYGQAVRLEALVALVYAFLVFCSLVYVGLASKGGEFVGLNDRIDALYFTMSTVGTVGFGDVHAEGKAARVVVTGQIFFDLVFLAAIARIIVPSLTWRGRGLHVPPPNPEDPEDPRDPGYPRDPRQG